MLRVLHLCLLGSDTEPGPEPNGLHPRLNQVDRDAGLLLTLPIRRLLRSPRPTDISEWVIERIKGESLPGRQGTVRQSSCSRSSRPRRQFWPWR